MNRAVVSVRKTQKDYPIFPYNPEIIFPEFDGFDLYEFGADSKNKNKIYKEIREIFIDLGFDRENIGKKNWNPLKDFVESGQKVVLKPNLVFDKHYLGINGTLGTITNASIIRPIIDYLLLATKGDIKITICDVPIQSADWDNLLEISGIKDLVTFYEKRGIKIEVLDLRKEISFTTKEGIVFKRVVAERDPLGYLSVDLGNRSALFPVIKYYKKFEITDYKLGSVSKHHNSELNEYCIPKTILEADFFVNIPKLKTHRKAGITFALKNLIGINGDKAWIAHHRRGTKRNGGDEADKFSFALFKSRIIGFLKRHVALNFMFILIKKFLQFLRKSRKKEELSISKNGFVQKEITEGSWHGNDTIWRVIKDINAIIFYANKSGKMENKMQRRYLCIGDAVICSDGEGPMRGQPRKEGFLFGGMEPVCIDCVAARLIGFDYKKIPQIREGFGGDYFWRICNFKKEDIVSKSNVEKIEEVNLKFRPSSGWTNLL